GMVASYTTLPVIGVPVNITALAGVDALHSIVQMPAGVPVATVGIGNARNAGLLAARMLGAHDAQLATRLDALRESMAMGSRAKNEKLQQERG
ncbi:MAG: AIR carboxylase family protein, partial [Planctomycetia bacterium]